MADETPKPQDAARALWSLGRGGMRRQEASSDLLSPLERFLREWQSARLANTYADFVASPEYGPATNFFLTDIYGPEDFSQRDADLTQLYDFFRRFMPPATLRVLKNTVELNDITHDLDDAMLVALYALDCTISFTKEQYETAYREGNYNARVRQIELIVEIGRDLARIGGLPFIGPTVRAARAPAERLGWGDLHSFLERGYQAWRAMPDPEVFLQAIWDRETAILNRIFGR